MFEIKIIDKTVVVIGNLSKLENADKPSSILESIQKILIARGFLSSIVVLGFLGIDKK
jgi:hypothetical protein